MTCLDSQYWTNLNLESSFWTLVNSCFFHPSNVDHKKSINCVALSIMISISNLILPFIYPIYLNGVSVCYVALLHNLLTGSSLGQISEKGESVPCCNTELKSREDPFPPTEKLIAKDDFLLLSSDSALELSKRKLGSEMISESHFERGAVFLSLDFVKHGKNY